MHSDLLDTRAYIPHRFPVRGVKAALYEVQIEPGVPARFVREGPQIVETGPQEMQRLPCNRHTRFIQVFEDLYKYLYSIQALHVPIGDLLKEQRLGLPKIDRSKPTEAANPGILRRSRVSGVLSRAIAGEESRRLLPGSQLGVPFHSARLRERQME